MSAPKHTHSATAVFLPVVVLGLLLSLALTGVASARPAYDALTSRHHLRQHAKSKHARKHRRRHRRHARAAAATTVVYDLCAAAGSTTPAGAPVAINVWSFVLKPPAGCAAATASLPAPTIGATPGTSSAPAITEGDTVQLVIENTLPDELDIEIPGVTLDNGSHLIPANATRTISFLATDPGSYLYESAGGAGRQAEVGLAGALVVGSNAPRQAYDDASSAYASDAVMLLSDVDTELNATLPSGLAGFDMGGWSPEYRLINGAAYPGTGSISATAGLSNRNVLLRYVNASSEHISMTILGADAKVVGRDGSFLTTPLPVSADTIPAGGTSDVLVSIPTSIASGTKIPVYERNLRLANGGASGLGGRVRFITVP